MRYVVRAPGGGFSDPRVLEPKQAGDPVVATAGRYAIAGWIGDGRFRAAILHG